MMITEATRHEHQLANYDYIPSRRADCPRSNRAARCRQALSLPLKQIAAFHHHVHELDQFYNQSDLMVLNRSKVIPARLHGHKETGGALEVLLVHAEHDQCHWRCLGT